MCAGKPMGYCNGLFLFDVKGLFSLVREVFEMSTETQIWPDFFLMNVSDCFLRLLYAKVKKSVSRRRAKKQLGIPTV